MSASLLCGGWALLYHLTTSIWSQHKSLDTTRDWSLNSDCSIFPSCLRTCQGCGCCCILWCGVTLLLSLVSALHSSCPLLALCHSTCSASPRPPASPGRPAAGGWPGSRERPVQCQVCLTPPQSHPSESEPALFKYYFWSRNMFWHVDIYTKSINIWKKDFR